jgi:hypothetical protein
MSETDSGLPLDASLDHVHNLSLTDSAGDSHRHLALMSIEHKVQTCGADGEVSNLYSLEELWKHGTVETHKTTSAIDLQAQTGLQELEAGAGRPGLWGTGRRIERGAFTRPSRESAEELRQPMKRDKEAGIEDSG